MAKMITEGRGESSTDDEAVCKRLQKSMIKISIANFCLLVDIFLDIVVILSSIVTF